MLSMHSYYLFYGFLCNLGECLDWCAIITYLHHCVFQENVGIAAATPEVSTLTTRATSTVATTTSVTVDHCTTARVD